jgi:hypothetical protein
MRPASHFGSFVAALALGLVLAAAGGAAYVASAPTIPAQDVIKAPVRAHATASTLSVWVFRTSSTRMSSGQQRARGRRRDLLRRGQQPCCDAHVTSLPIFRQ